uniref:Uncharacterized protein n=1 Tax=Cercocebus atys TaxID=9531 RepID=A0A2K5MAF9_CERAT
FLKAKMSILPPEKVKLDIVAMFHQYSGDDGTIDMPGLVNLMKENFLNFLRGCEKATQITFFFPLLGDVAIHYPQIMHGAGALFWGS